ncbi:MAG: Protoheme farnesyltransferase 1 [Planctomycetota bacterium]
MSAAASLPVTAIAADRFADYRLMVRPRILVMSAVAVAAGFVLASPETVDWLLLTIAAPSICLLVAASSVLNQVLESDSDYLMNRTSGRPLASGRISRREGLLFGLLLASCGTALLWLFVNPATSVASLLTMLCYVLGYTPLKRRSEFCTTVGAVPGAMPPVLGWLAAGNAPGIECIALFAIFFVWQFPHFLAIGWIYRHQYQAAGLKMLPSFTDEGRLTGLIALIYAVAFVPVACLPRFVGLAGTGYLAAAILLSSGYLWLTLQFSLSRSEVRARRLLAGSLICLPVLLGCLVFDFLRLTV